MDSKWDCEESGHIFSDENETCLFCDAKCEDITEEDYTIQDCDKGWLYDF